jgi:hypothetical protein
MDPSTPSTTAAAQPDRAAQVADFLRQIRAKQSINGAIAGGFLGAVVGAILWALITVVTNFEIGWEAVGVGFLVGYGVRKLGGGIDPVFGYIGAILAGFGIALGNIVTGMIVVSKYDHIPLLTIASKMSGPMAWTFLTASFTPVDVLFYAFGIYYGFRYSIRRFTFGQTT